MNDKVINAQLGLLIQIVRCIQMKRVLSEIDPVPELNFWRIIHGGLLDLPTLDWCKVFGSNAEPTHWKGVIEDVDKFKKELFENLNITQPQWEKYWNHLKNYRDELIAHYEIESDVSTYPDLDIAFKSSCFYHDYLNNQVNDGVDEPMQRLEDYSMRFYNFESPWIH